SNIVILGGRSVVIDQARNERADRPRGVRAHGHGHRFRAVARALEHAAFGARGFAKAVRCVLEDVRAQIFSACGVEIGDLAGCAFGVSGDAAGGGGPGLGFSSKATLAAGIGLSVVVGKSGAAFATGGGASAAASSFSGGTTFGISIGGASGIVRSGTLSLSF